MTSQDTQEGPDLRSGVPLSQLEETGLVGGLVDGEPVLLARCGTEIVAVSNRCTHYGASLHEGVQVGDTVRCPWHHTCFSLRTGAVLAPPAQEPLGRWQTVVEDGRVRVLERIADAPPVRAVPPRHPASVTIVGAGAAGSAAARKLREEGYRGAIRLIDPDPDAPYDRPNLSKDYLAGTAPAEWLPLWPEDFAARHLIERVVAQVAGIDLEARALALTDGRQLPYDVLLLAPGAFPVRPPVPGHDLPHVHVLRSLADCRALLQLPAGTPVLIAGASFIGLEAAAALRARGLEVTVVAPEPVPFERILGRELGSALRALHERHGVRFRLGRTLAGIEPERVLLDDGSVEAAAVVLLGVGVRPATAFAGPLHVPEAPGGIEVDAFLRTRYDGVYAAGDVAWYPDAVSGERVRIEHWVVAQRQGAAAARNILGHGEPFRAVPFFWTQQHDLTLSYVGHASSWDELVVDGSIEGRDCRITYLRAGRVLAVATIGRDRESLRAELALEAAAAASPTAPAPGRNT